MKPIEIKKTLDLARQVKRNGGTLVPCFSGDAGVGKSQIVMEWVNEQIQQDPDFIFLDLRIAFMEQPDLIGFPKEIEIIDKITNKKILITKHCIPEFFYPFTNPDAKGIIIFEEPNRGTTGVMNCLMQMLTDNRVHTSKFGKDVIMCACINPDLAEFDVNSMDVALKDRFVTYDISYDHKSFIDYIEKNDWDEMLQLFIKSGMWTYQSSDNIGAEGTYISPRSLSRVNSARKAGLGNDPMFHHVTVCSILGSNIGNEFHKHCFDKTPVISLDFFKNNKDAFRRLKEYSKDNNAFGDMIYQTIESVSRNFTLNEKDDTENKLVGLDTIGKIAMILPKDQSINLMRNTIIKGDKCDTEKVKSTIKIFLTKYPKLKQSLRDNIKIIDSFQSDKDIKDL